ncbi:hypothetical protein RRJ83_000469 [Vibrio parahaemolyticus]|nr:hypothetical protein [Vibrio parahaemolyticus]ELI5427413.1 hypothetical protein [Vibrio parahaemolyticus]
MAINLKAIASAMNIITPIASKLKTWIFSDGKFNLKRAVILLLSACLIGGSVHYMGYEQTEQIIELVDQASDIIGYAE